MGCVAEADFAIRPMTAADAHAVAVETALWTAFDDEERELFRAFLRRASEALRG